MYKVITKTISGISVFCLVAITTCAQIDSVFKLPFPQQYEAVNWFIGAGKDSATDVRKVAMLLEKAKQTHNELNILNMERASLAIDQLWRVDPQHIEAKAAALIRRADELDCHPVVTFAYEALGDYYYESHRYTPAFEYHLRAYNDYHNLYKNEFPDMSETQYTLAYAYYKFNDYKNALRYSKDLVGNDHKKRKAFLVILINDLVGMSYLKLHRYDSAITYFQKTLLLAPSHHDPTAAIAWMGIAKGNIGLALAQQHKYDTAIAYLLQGVDLAIKGNVPDNTASFAVCLSGIYLARKDAGAAQKYLQIARDAAYKANDLHNYCELYTAFCAFYRQQGNTAMALRYQDSALIYKDSLAAITDVNKKHLAEMAIADEHLRESQLLAAKERQKQVLIRNGLIVIVLMIMLFTLLFYNRRLLKQKYKRKQLLAEKKIAEAELASAKRLLTDFTKNMAEKNELIETLSSRANSSIDADLLQQLQQSVLVTDEQWESFRELFEQVHTGYLYRLKEKLPGLTPAETRFMALNKLKLSNKEMSAMLGNSPDAIRQYRSRIRKKYSIPDDRSIEDLAESI